MLTTQSVDAVAIAYEVIGDGPDLVLFHPSLSASKIWHDLGYVDALAGEYRLILIDARGHGHSGKPGREEDYAMGRLVGDVVAVLDAMQIDRAHLFGYSLGGRVALGCGVYAPERFASLIVGAGSFDEQTGGFDLVTYPGALETLATSGIDTFLERWTSRAGYALPVSVESTFRSCNPAAIVPFLRQMDRDPSLRDSLPHIELPTLLFAGEFDDYRLTAMRSAAQLIPNARVDHVPGGTHLSTLMQSEAVLGLVQPFLDRVNRPVEGMAR